MITAIEIAIWLLEIILLVLPTGFLFLLILSPSRLKKDRIIPDLFVVIGLGLGVSLCFWWLMSLWSFSNIVVLFFPTLSFVLVLFLKRKRRIPYDASDWRKDAFFSRANGLFLIFGFISFGFFSYITLMFSWSQVGDPWYLGLMTSVLQSQGKIPFTYAPISDNPINYPMGFPLLSAIGTSLTGLPPGMTMIMTSAFCMAMIPIMAAWLTLRKTDSLVLACLVFLLGFYTHPSSRAHYSLYNMFLNGTYPVSLGSLLVLTILCCFTFVPVRKSRPPSSHTRYHMIFLILSFSVFVSYAPFVVLPAIGILLVWFWKAVDFHNRALKGSMLYRMTSSSTILFVMAVGILSGVYLLASDDFSFFNTVFSELQNSFQGYAIEPPYFLEGIALPVIVLGVLGCVMELRRNPRSVNGWIVLFFSCLLILSLVPFLFNIGLSLLLPSRLAVFLAVCNYVYLAYLLGNWYQGWRLDGYSIPEWPKRTASRIHYGIMFTSVVLIAVIMIPSISRVMVEFPNQWDWYLDSSEFNDDLAGIMALRNIHNGSLVLNYMTYSDYFLPAAGIVNVVFDRQANVSRGRQLEEIWKQPTNSTLVQSLLYEYQVEFIFVSSSTVMLDLLGNSRTRIDKPAMASEYIAIFLSYIILERVFNQGDCAIFRVHHS